MSNTNLKNKIVVFIKTGISVFTDLNVYIRHFAITLVKFLWRCTLSLLSFLTTRTLYILAFEHGANTLLKPFTHSNQNKHYISLEKS